MTGVMPEPGEAVRITAYRMGLLETVDSVRFEDELAKEGDLGVYVGLHSKLDDWHIVRVTVDGRELVCPCHVSQFEAVAQS